MSEHTHLRDLQKVTERGFAAALLYAGYDLYEIVASGKMISFGILCPRFDFETYQNDWNRGTLALSDARTFCQRYRELFELVKLAQRDGSWKNLDYSRLEELSGEED